MFAKRSFYNSGLQTVAWAQDVALGLLLYLGAIFYPLTPVWQKVLLQQYYQTAAKGPDVAYACFVPALREIFHSLTPAQFLQVTPAIGHGYSQ